MDLAGYHTVKLQQNVPVKEGEWFSVVVKLKNPSYAYPVAVEQRVKGYADNVAVNAGNCYFSGDGKTWTDGAKLPSLNKNFSPSNACIKAFTLCGKEEPKPKDEPKPKPDDDDDDDDDEDWDEEDFEDFDDDYDDDYDEEDWDDEDYDDDDDEEEDDDEDEDWDEEDEEYDDDGEEDDDENDNSDLDMDDYDVGIILIPKRR